MMDIKSYDTVVIGSGASGYNAVCRIKQDGRKSVCMVTEGQYKGTSRNTGSDKQTYYKLGLGGSMPDSVRKMAEDLFSCGAADGDNALCEAALSARCFYHLCEAGVPFPSNRYGEYVGYKTDHDPYARATSAGPLTSKFMTEALEKKALDLGVEIYDSLMAIEILKKKSSVCGLLCLNVNNGEFVAFRCSNIVMATGGPAGIYSDSVYPESQSGSTGLALLAGASLQNMTEWQYGLASLDPRWNVSGTYMQVLPRFVSVDEEGSEYEFLSDYFEEPYDGLSKVFLKGYQWPFDIKKVMQGSSVIDLLVYVETVIKKRRVFLDFTKNPFSLCDIEYEKLSLEAYTYLRNAEVLFGKPIDRLKKMNLPAAELYANKGVDLEKDYLEIALCAQHNNGGVSVDKWWQTSIRGLFAVGECAGTHGITRPGGSALNAGQVGSLRAAQYICESEEKCVSEEEFNSILLLALNKNTDIKASALKNGNNADESILFCRRQMSEYGGAIRNIGKMKKLFDDVKIKLAGFSSYFGVSSENDIYKIYRLRDILTVQLATLFSMIDYAENMNSSRGSSLYTDIRGMLPDGLPETFRFSFDDAQTAKEKIQEISFVNGSLKAVWRSPRPVPKEESVFESVWRRYRADKNIY